MGSRLFRLVREELVDRFSRSWPVSVAVFIEHDDATAPDLVVVVRERRPVRLVQGTGQVLTCLSLETLGGMSDNRRLGLRAIAA